MEQFLRLTKKLLPQSVFTFFQPAYHFLISIAGALAYRFPSRHIKVIAVTGTKGKSSTVEILNSIFEEAGYKTAVLGTVRFKIGEKTERNLFKMTMPGRFFLQKFLRRAVKAGCSHAIIEMTSEGAKQFRHLFIDLDALVVTNIAKEHIESHGSFEKYVDAKVSIARQLARSRKPRRRLIINSDMKNADDFTKVQSLEVVPYSLKDAVDVRLSNSGAQFTFKGENITSKLPGEFNVYNCLAAATAAASFDIPSKITKKALENVERIRGRAEEVREGQNFRVIVDYAHTADSLEAIYKAFPGRKICVLGATGGGRDKWKRPEMGKVADAYCDAIVLTDDDSYDEDPRTIVEEIATGILHHTPETVLDRRLAIKHAFSIAKAGDTVLLTGKGTDPYLMGPNGLKTPWDDAQIAREELKNLSA